MKWRFGRRGLFCNRGRDGEISTLQRVSMMRATRRRRAFVYHNIGRNDIPRDCLSKLQLLAGDLAAQQHNVI